MSKKITFLSKGITPEERKRLFIEQYPWYKDWPYWDSLGYPTPDPAELATFTEPAYDFE
jgi:hypothetical protein